MLKLGMIAALALIPAVPGLSLETASDAGFAAGLEQVRNASLTTAVMQRVFFLRDEVAAAQAQLEVLRREREVQVSSFRVAYPLLSGATDQELDRVISVYLQSRFGGVHPEIQPFIAKIIGRYDYATLARIGFVENVLNWFEAIAIPTQKVIDAEARVVRLRAELAFAQQQLERLLPPPPKKRSERPVS